MRVKGPGLPPQLKDSFRKATIYDRGVDAGKDVKFGRMGREAGGPGPNEGTSAVPLPRRIV